ncbi:MAG TPA: SDR family NAD(P)-dependent oxidoreductase, partial [Polyangiaceae bacterium]|nr:SDR family NAD(P)-dependent oxidoreductase [Polyangiaceae bacterium]
MPSPDRAPENTAAELSPPRRVLVTGAGTRVGQAIAVALAAPQVSVGVHYHTNRQGAEQTQALIEANGAKAVLLQADLNDIGQARGLIDECVSRLEGLDLLVLSAASFERVPFDSLSDEAWNRSLALNCSAQFAMAHQASGALRQSSGSMVFITCASTLVPMRNYLPYVVSKGALRHLMRTLALELAPDVRVNAVAPGTVLPAEDMSDAAVQ